jgi:hypothetical protein
MFFPRSPVFVASGELKLPPKPGIPSHGFPQSPVMLLSAFAPVPEGANRLPCGRPVGREELRAGLLDPRQTQAHSKLRLVCADVRYLDRRTRSSCSNLSNSWKYSTAARMIADRSGLNPRPFSPIFISSMIRSWLGSR